MIAHDIVAMDGDSGKGNSTSAIRIDHDPITNLVILKSHAEARATHLVVSEFNLHKAVYGVANDLADGTGRDAMHAIVV
jgi:hypothetical protein